MEKIFKTSLLIQGILWMILGGINILNSSNLIYLSFGGMMIINGIIFLILSRKKHSSSFTKIFTLIFVLINLILTLTDQLGAFDYIVLALNLLTLLSFILKTKK